jgi:hypothetical protein
MTSCTEEPVENYRHSMVVGKFDSPPTFLLKKWDGGKQKYIFVTIYVCDYDFDKYNVGDTIK